MKYMGSKRRIRNEICTYINNIALCENINNYIEPFVGGANIIEYVNIKNRIGYDLNKYLIALYKKLQQDDKFEYPALTIEQWNDIRYNKDEYDDWLVCWAGLFCSFNTKWFASWGGDYYDKYGDYYNAQLNAYNGILTEIELLKNIEFIHSNYKDIQIHNNSIVYCDAPYRNTIGYKGANESFNFKEYDDWLIETAKNNFVLISEYTMDSNRFKCIDEFRLDKLMGKTTSDIKEVTEKLYVVKGGYLVDKYFNDDILLDF